MQDRYAGDVGDFVKLGLLRALAPNHSLGVAWYRFPDEAHNKDGYRSMSDEDDAYNRLMKDLDAEASDAGMDYGADDDDDDDDDDDGDGRGSFPWAVFGILVVWLLVNW